MGFELLVKRSERMIPTDAVQVNKCSIAFGSTICDFFKTYPYVEVYFDRENKLVGFKGCNNPVTGFKLEKKGKSNKKSISAKQAQTAIPNQRYNAVFEKGYAVISVPSLAVANE